METLPKQYLPLFNILQRKLFPMNLSNDNTSFQMLGYINRHKGGNIKVVLITNLYYIKEMACQPHKIYTYLGRLQTHHLFAIIQYRVINGTISCRLSFFQKRGLNLLFGIQQDYEAQSQVQKITCMSLPLRLHETIQSVWDN